MVMIFRLSTNAKHKFFNFTFSYLPLHFSKAQFTDGAVELDFVPGNHVTMMREPNVPVLAEKLRAWLARVNDKG